MKSAIFFLILTSCLSCVSYRNTQWYTEQGGCDHHGYVNSLIRPPLRIRWQKELAGAISATVVGNSKYIYIGAGITMYCLNPDNGAIVWSYQATEPIESTATIIEKDSGKVSFLYFATRDGVLHCLDGNSGHQLWSAGNPIRGLPGSSTNYAAGLVFYTRETGDMSFTVKAVLDTDGSHVWDIGTPDVHMATPLPAGDKILHGEQASSFMHAYNLRTGTLEWSSPFFEGFYTTGINGLINYDVGVGNTARYIYPLQARSSHQVKIVAVNPENGSLIWSNNLSEPDGGITGLAINQYTENNALIITRHNSISRMNPMNGQLVWRTEFMAPGLFNMYQPAITRNVIYHVTGGNQLQAFDISNGQILGTFLMGYTGASPAIGDKTIYIGNSSGILYALSPSN